jgi:hypothetical protein
LSHEFGGDKESFQKGKSVRKGPPKQKLRADIVKMLGALKKSQNGGFECYFHMYFCVKKVSKAMMQKLEKEITVLVFIRWKKYSHLDGSMQRNIC